jgi:hypothetical protein
MTWIKYMTRKINSAILPAVRLKTDSFLRVQLLTVLLSINALSVSALTNIVNNGSFDQGEWGWQFTVGYSIEPAYVVVHGTLAQNLTTVPGRDYVVRFAVKNSMPRLYWGDQSYETFTNIPAPSTWQYVYRFVRANSTTTRLMFENVASVRPALDDVVVGWLREPATIVDQPQSRSSPDGGSVSFTVTADGGPPLYYQWFFNGQPIPGASNSFLIQHEVDSSRSGDYHVIVSNVVNAVTSTVATLTVDPLPAEPLIAFHPESQDVPAGYWHALRTASIGSPPLAYQWFFNGSELAGATNSTLVFVTAHQTNAGTYTVRVSNYRGSVVSLPAILGVYTLTNLGTYISVATDIPKVPVFDVDGYTPVTRSNFLAQIYTGPSAVILRAAGDIIQFMPGSLAGTLRANRHIPDVAPGQPLFAQLRVWETAWGKSYEETRARGGKFGFSPIVSIVGEPLPTLNKLPMTSFILRYGLPQFTTGKLAFARRLSDRTIEWRLTGEPGFRYLIERRLPPHNWKPLVILTNENGTVTFTDPDQQNSSSHFYRSRMLE